MNSFDEEAKKMFEEFKNDVQVSPLLEQKVMNSVRVMKRRSRNKRILLSTVSAALICVFLISFSVPVFGKNGTLPQFIEGIKIEHMAAGFSGDVPAEEGTINQLKDSELSPVDSVIAIALTARNDVPIEKIIELRKAGLGWGKIISDLNLNIETIEGVFTKEGADNAENGFINKAYEEDAGGLKTGLVIKGTLEKIEIDRVYIHGYCIFLTENTSITYGKEQFSAKDLKTGWELIAHCKRNEGHIIAENIDVLNIKEKEEYKTIQINGTVTAVMPGAIVVDSTPFLVSDDVVIKEKGNKIYEDSISIGDHVIVKARGSFALEITITEWGENGEHEFKSHVISLHPGLLRIEGFAHDIIINGLTEIEELEGRKISPTSIKTGDAILVHIRKDGEKYYATHIVKLSVLKEESFKGIVGAIDRKNKVLILKNKRFVFRIRDTATNIEFDKIDVGDAVEIKGIRENEILVNIRQVNIRGRSK